MGGREVTDFLDAAHALATAIPGSRLDVIEDAGYLLPLEAPEELRMRLLDFLRAAEAGPIDPG